MYIYTVQGVQVVSAEGYLHHSPCWAGGGRQQRSQPHLSLKDAQKLLHFPVTLLPFQNVKDWGCDSSNSLCSPRGRTLLHGLWWSVYLVSQLTAHHVFLKGWDKVVCLPFPNYFLACPWQQGELAPFLWVNTGWGWKFQQSPLLRFGHI